MAWKPLGIACAPVLVPPDGRSYAGDHTHLRGGRASYPERSSIAAGSTETLQDPLG